MKLKRLLGAETGWGGAMGTLLLLGSGLVLLFISVGGMPEASRLEPEARGCAAWLADPSGARWVTVVGCQLDLSGMGFESTADGGVLVPLVSPGSTGRALLATSDAELIRLKDGFDGGLTGMVKVAGGAVTLEHGQQPRRGNVLLGLVLGLIAVALAVRSMFMRYLVERDSTV